MKKKKDATYDGRKNEKTRFGVLCDQYQVINKPSEYCLWLNLDKMVGLRIVALSGNITTVFTLM